MASRADLIVGPPTPRGPQPTNLVFGGGGVVEATEAVIGAQIASLGLAGQGQATFTAPEHIATVAAQIASLALSGHAVAAHGVQASAAARLTSLNLTGLVTAKLATASRISAQIASLSLTCAAAAQHPRYELRGQVRLAGNPVERLVRAYRRDTGALLGQGDTTGGFFRIPAGFAEIECTVLPIDLATDATDYEPPTANRVLCVLAEDDA